ncbi:MAG: outer membrane lipoprotein carrier protein LolA [Betaproteobacteria bacterium]|nr:MAG: outer membrane lipoprotein carrier protein LolA [Betaproteobacteria bacterium]
MVIAESVSLWLKIMKRIAFVFVAGLIGLIALPALAQPANSLTEFRAFTKDLSSLSGTFTQEVRDKNGRVSRASSGSFSIARPGKFRFIYEKPYKQTIVSDGVTVWLHDEDLNQVTIRKIGDALAEQPLALLLDPTAAEKVFELKSAPPRGSIGYVEARARKAESAVSELMVAVIGTQPSELTWRDALQNVNTLRFGKLTKNSVASGDLFQFAPPAGADILKQ